MNPTFTDWLEAVSTAIGAGAAIFAGWYAYKAYKKQNKDVQAQIDGLKTLAEHQAKENELVHEQILLEKRKRRTDIRPVLTLLNSLKTDKVFTCIVKNLGKTAYKVFLHKLNEKGESIDKRSISNELKIDEEVFLVINTNDEQEYHGISFQDEDENDYIMYLMLEKDDAKVTPTKPIR